MSNNVLQGYNMTNFFNRELSIYALGDIRFKKPISMKKAAFTMGGFLVWSLPIVMFSNFQFTPWYLALIIIPPVLLGQYAVKKVFYGKTLLQFITTMWKFIQEPKGWTDLKNNNSMGKDAFYVEDEIWISRRRELALLQKLKAEQKEAKREAKAAQREARRSGSRELVNA